MNHRDFLMMRANEIFRDEADRISIRHDTSSVRDGWYEASCDLHDWYTSGSEPNVEDAVGTHVAERHPIGQLVAGLQVALKLADDTALRALATPFGDHRDHPDHPFSQIRGAVEALRANHDDSEAAHASEDAIHVAALKVIAAGYVDAADLAAEALKTSEIEFSRHRC